LPTRMSFQEKIQKLENIKKVWNSKGKEGMKMKGKFKRFYHCQNSDFHESLFISSWLLSGKNGCCKKKKEKLRKP